MKVTITYIDPYAFTIEEVVKQAVHNYGELAQIDVAPESSLAYDHIYFGLQQLISHEQLSLLFDNSVEYSAKVSELRNSVMSKVSEIIDQVIIDNEAKVV